MGKERVLLFIERMAKDPDPAGVIDEATMGTDDTCDLWDWARTAGLSREELQKAIEARRQAPATTERE